MASAYSLTATNTRRNETMTTDTKDALQKAIEYLGAVEVAPFTFAWQNADGWWTLDHKYIRILFNYIHGHAPLEPLSKKQLGLTKMPPWWSPQTQETFGIRRSAAPAGRKGGASMRRFVRVPRGRGDAIAFLTARWEGECLRHPVMRNEINA